jgi:hypothetical protein
LGCSNELRELPLAQSLLFTHGTQLGRETDRSACAVLSVLPFGALGAPGLDVVPAAGGHGLSSFDVV